MFTVYKSPVPVHCDTGLIHAIAAYDSRKVGDKVLVFQTGERRYVHLAATSRELVGVTRKIKRAVRREINYLRPDKHITQALNSLHELLAGMTSFTVERDGTRIAFRSGNKTVII